MTRAPRVLSTGLVWVAAAWTWAAFFLPWVHIALRDPAIANVLTSQSEVGKALGQLLGNAGHVKIAIQQPEGVVETDLAALAALPPQVTGAQIPQLLREERMQVALAMIELWQGGRRQPWAQRSRMVYAVPGFALLAALLLTGWGRSAPVAWTVAAGLLAAAGYAAWWWRAHDFATSTVVVTLEFGLWSSWLAYLVMAGAAVIGTLQSRSPHR